MCPDDVGWLYVEDGETEEDPGGTVELLDGELFHVGLEVDERLERGEVVVRELPLVVVVILDDVLLFEDVVD